MLRKSAAALAAFVILAGPAAAHDFKVGPIEIGHPWSRPTPPAASVASGYLTLTNTGGEKDRLVEIVSPIAEKAEIHSSTIENGVAKMRPVEGLELDPGATVDFEAARLHVMFIEPEHPLKDGDRFPATLIFENAGPVDVEFVVQRVASEPPAQDHSGHGG